MSRMFVILVLLAAASLSCGSSDKEEPVVFKEYQGNDINGPQGDGEGTEGLVTADSVTQELPADVCVSECGGKSCGSDGCGGSCGDCPAEYSCDGNGICQHDACVSDCTGKQCGDDGCGGECGVCTACGQVCQNGQCVFLCTPSCTGKECGTDECGCGLDCGECIAGWQCVNGQCACAASCDGKECGDNGCGGSCGSCGGNLTCDNGVCTEPPCQKAQAVSCGQTIVGSNCGYETVFYSYGCGFDASGPEVGHEFSTNTKQFVMVTIDHDNSGMLDLYILNGDCDPSVCVTNDTKQAFWTAAASTPYIIMVEGYSGTCTDYTMEVKCTPSGNCPDGKIPGCGTQCGWGHWYGDGMCSSVFDCVEAGFDGGDCN